MTVSRYGYLRGLFSTVIWVPRVGVAHGNVGEWSLVRHPAKVGVA